MADVRMTVSVVVSLVGGLVLGLVSQTAYTILVRLGARISPQGLVRNIISVDLIEDVQYRLTAYQRYATQALSILALGFGVAVSLGLLPSLTSVSIQPVVLGIAAIVAVAGGEALYRLGADRTLRASPPLPTVTPKEYEVEVVQRLRELLGPDARVTRTGGRSGAVDAIIESGQRSVAVAIFAGALFTGSVLRDHLTKVLSAHPSIEALLVVVNGLPSRRSLDSVAQTAHGANLRFAIATWIPGFGDSDLERGLREVGLSTLS